MCNITNTVCSSSVSIKWHVTDSPLLVVIWKYIHVASVPGFFSCAFNMFTFTPTFSFRADVGKCNCVASGKERDLIARLAARRWCLSGACLSPVRAVEGMQKCKELCPSLQSLLSLTRAKLSQELVGASPWYPAWDAGGTENVLQVSHTSYLNAWSLICWHSGNSMTYWAFICLKNMSQSFCEPSTCWELYIFLHFLTLCKDYCCVGNTLSTKAGPQGASLELLCPLW